MVYSGVCALSKETKVLTETKIRELAAALVVKVRDGNRVRRSAIEEEIASFTVTTGLDRKAALDLIKEVCTLNSVKIIDDIEADGNIKSDEEVDAERTVPLGEPIPTFE